MRRSSAVVAFVLALASSFTPLAADELILVPLWYQGGGAQGSMWTTHLSVFNTGGYLEPNDRGVLPCQWLMDPCPRGFWEDKMLVYQAPMSMPGGFLMAVANPDKLSYALRVFEATAHMEDLGVDVPVVRERELRTGPVQIMDIPVADPELFRFMVRIYGIGNVSRAFARVNGYVTMGDGSPDLVVTKEVTLARMPHGLGHYYVEENDVVRDLIRATGGMGQLRIEIEPVSANMRWWAMVSATNNRSQDVTIITPN